MFKYQKKKNNHCNYPFIPRSSISCNLITTQRTVSNVRFRQTSLRNFYDLANNFYENKKKKNTCCCCNRWGWPQRNLYQKQEEHLPLTSPTFSAIICEEGEGSHCSRRHCASKKMEKKAKIIYRFFNSLICKYGAVQEKYNAKTNPLVFDSNSKCWTFLEC